MPFQIEARTDIDKTVNGGVVRILVEAKSLPEGEKLVGEFEGTDFLFFALPPEQGAHRYEALLGIPHDRKPGKGVIRVKSFKGAPGATLAELSIEIEDGKYPLEHLKVDGKHVNPPKKVMARIKLEGSEVHKVFSRKTEERMWTGPFKFPIQSAITSPYGTKRMYNGEERNFHGGLDLKAAVGTEIHAPQDGIVYLAKDLYFTGNSVMIDHGYGLVTLYAHMSKLKVKVGQRVKTGDLLGLSGATGRVSGPHLHWQIYINSVKVSPLLFMKTLEEETVPRLK